MVEPQQVWLMVQCLPSLSKLMDLFFITKFLQQTSEEEDQAQMLLQLPLKRESILPQLLPMPELL